MTKKIIAFALSLLLLVSLAACGMNSTPVTPPDSSPAPSDTADPSKNPDPAPESGDSQTPENSQTPEDGSAPDGQTDEAYVPGTVEELTYSSEFLGLSVTLDSGWIIADEQQLAQLAGLVSESFDSESLAKALESGTVVYDLYALRTKDNASVNITVQEMGHLGGILVDEDAYADSNLAALPDILSDAGITVQKLEKASLEFAGSSHPALVLEGSTGDVPLFETLVFWKVGPYMAVITAASYQPETTPSSLLELFRPAEKPET